jgi:hypothetical protein
MKNNIFISIFIIIILNTAFNFKICPAQWTKISNGINENTSIFAFTNTSLKLFAGTDNGIYSTTNYGLIWTHISSLNGKRVLSFATSGSTIYAGTLLYGAYISTNSGITWHQTSLINNIVNALIFSGSNILAGVEGIYSGGENFSGGGIYMSSNSGTNWILADLQNYNIFSFSKNSSTYFAGSNYRVHVSTNNGLNWSGTTLNQKILSLAEKDNSIFAGTEKRGIYITTNNGSNWILKSLYNEEIYTIATSGIYVFAGTKNSGVFFSKDNGDNWIQKNQGLGNLTVNSLFIINNIIFAGTGDGVWKRDLIDIIYVKKLTELIPLSYLLYQNYPNPFNPSTIIRFQIKDSRFVTLKVYDILGKEVKTLVNEKQSPGIYEVSYDGSNHSSGIYFYSLYIDGIRFDTKRMVLIK